MYSSRLQLDRDLIKSSNDVDFIISGLENFVSEERRKRINETIEKRCYSVIPVLENLYDRGNASAVMRSAEGLGFGSVELIQPGERFKEANRVTQGADKWLDTPIWKSTAEAVSSLRLRGYKICVTTLEEAKPIDEIDFTHQPTALFFCNEKDGASEDLLSLSDERMIIPMQGFTQSYNISVAAAMSLYHVFQSRSKTLGKNADLSEEEKKILLANYYYRSVGNATKILERKMNETSVDL